MNACSPINGMLICAVRKISRATSSSCHLGIGRKNSAAPGHCLISHELVLVIIASVPLAPTIVAVSPIWWHSVLIARGSRVN